MIRILTIGSDQTLFNPASPSALRIIKYGELVDLYQIIVFTHACFKPVKLSDKVKVYPTNSRSRLFFIGDAWRLAKKIVAEQEINLVSAQDPHISALIGYGLKRKYHTALNIQCHGNWFGSSYWRNKNLALRIFYYLGRFLVTKANSLRVVSSQIADSLKKLKVDPKKIKVLPLITDCQKFINQPPRLDLHSLHPNKKIMLFVGRLSKEKNLPALFKLFKIVQQQLTQALLVVVGQGPEELYLKSLVKKLNLTDQVIFYPWQEDIVSFYKTADVFILPSLTEGYNRTVVEALACGCPVIMTPVGPAGDLVINGFNGLVASGDIIKDMPPLVVKVLTNENLAKKLIANGLASISKLPTPEQYLHELLSNWQEALNNNKAKIVKN